MRVAIDQDRLLSGVAPSESFTKSQAMGLNLLTLKRGPTIAPSNLDHLFPPTPFSPITFLRHQPFRHHLSIFRLVILPERNTSDKDMALFRRQALSDGMDLDLKDA